MLGLLLLGFLTATLDKKNVCHALTYFKFFRLLVKVFLILKFLLDLRVWGSQNDVSAVVREI